MSILVDKKQNSRYAGNSETLEGRAEHQQAVKRVEHKFANDCTERRFSEIGVIGFSEPVSVDYSLHKKVLITGAHSYIGESFEKYAHEHYLENFEIGTIDLIDGTWRQTDFSSYDAVFHVAGIAHADVGNVSEETKKKYYAVNTDLAIETAQKAKDAGVKQFVFMSSMIVYGESAGYGKARMITRDTVPTPANFYGDSKWQADKGVRALADDNFHVTVLRPPMVYGRGSKSNYPTLAKMAKKLLVFPKVDNQRSMLYVENLCEFLCQIMLLGKGGVFIPQNRGYTKTSEMVKEIARVSGKKVRTLGILEPAVLLGSKMPGKIGGLVNKAFGNMTYDQGMSEYPGINYQITSLKESIVKSEGTGMQKEKKALMLASVASMIELFNEDNINILLDLGYQVDVACNFEEGSITSQERVDKYKKKLEERGIGTYQIPIPRSISRVKEIVSSYQVTKKLVDNNDYQIVHCHSPIGSVICRLACRDARKKGTKVIYTAHGFHFFNGASKKAWAVYYPVEKECSRLTDVLITINQEDYKRAQEFHSEKVEYVPGIGVHTKEFQNTVIDRRAKREEFGFEDNDFIFMSTGQLSVRKNHEVIIRALAELKNPNVKYLIAGFGEEEDKLKKLVMDLGISSQVVFAGYRSDVKELLHAVDGFAFPSLQEGLPVALMEAMSVGLPIVCSKIRGNEDLVVDGVGGFLVDPHDIEGFKKGMEQIVSGVSKKIGAANIETMKKFDIEAVNVKMEKIYMEA
jgi:UDP-glucose 4-epimerase